MTDQSPVRPPIMVASTVAFRQEYMLVEVLRMALELILAARAGTLRSMGYDVGFPKLHYVLHGLTEFVSQAIANWLWPTPDFTELLQLVQADPPVSELLRDIGVEVGYWQKEDPACTELLTGERQISPLEIIQIIQLIISLLMKFRDDE